MVSSTLKFRIIGNQASDKMAEKHGNILLIDDDDGILLTLRILLRKRFASIETEMNPENIPERLKQKDYDVVMLDMNFSIGATSGREGFHWLNTVRTLSPDSQVVMMTAYADIDLAIKAIKEGATDFVIKPWNNDKLIETVTAAYKKSLMGKEPPKSIEEPTSTSEVDRVFMFLDLKSSTEIAESLGHNKYFDLLNDFFSDISDPIVACQGEIYQYVGDEVVITWPLDKGIEKAQCLQCFFHICDVIEMGADRYVEKYGLIPEFKAGMHYGKVTTGSIGTIKKETVFSGEVLSTASRIEGLCNQYRVNLLLSKDLLNLLPIEESLVPREIDSIVLRGKQESITLFSVERVKANG